MFLWDIPFIIKRKGIEGLYYDYFNVDEEKLEKPENIVKKEL
jgi:hypothetical protein